MDQSRDRFRPWKGLLPNSLSKGDLGNGDVRVQLHPALGDIQTALSVWLYSCSTLSWWPFRCNISVPGGLNRERTMTIIVYSLKAISCLGFKGSNCHLFQTPGTQRIQSWVPGKLSGINKVSCLSPKQLRVYNICFSRLPVWHLMKKGIILFYYYSRFTTRKWTQRDVRPILFNS